jgi:hypothetical protein
MFLGLHDPDPDPSVRGTDPDPMFPFSEIMLAKWNFNTKFEQKIYFLRLKIMCLWVSCNKKYGEK